MIRRRYRALLSVAVVFLVGEALLRIAVDSDADGNLSLAGRRIRPYRFPTLRMEQMLDSYRAEDARLQWSASLGWEPKPGSQSADGRYSYDSQGRRVESLAKRDDNHSANTVVALFGDSFIHSSDVGFEESLGRNTQLALQSAGVSASVVNMGVPGYGMDQALLRYEQAAQDLDADVVVFGLQMENSSRNMNLCRAMLHPKTGMPFLKPRFVLADGNLALINSPTPGPERLCDLYQDIESWELIGSDAYYSPIDYRRLWLHRSYLASVAWHSLVPKSRPVATFSVDSERCQLVIKIIERFATTAERHGSEFVILHIPIRPYLSACSSTGEWPYQELLSYLGSRYTVVDPGSDILEFFRSNPESVSVSGSAHYSGLTNRLVADHLSRVLK